jgi:hypothetical protein
MISAEEEFNITKLQMLEAEKAKIRREYERKEASVDVKKKASTPTAALVAHTPRSPLPFIALSDSLSPLHLPHHLALPLLQVEMSKQSNDSRLKVLRAREEAMQRILREAEEQLAALAKDPASYTALLVELVAQAALRLKEPRVLVRCRKEDEELVRQALPLAAARCREAGGSAAEALQLELDERNPLPPAPKPGVADEGMVTWYVALIYIRFPFLLICSFSPPLGKKCWTEIVNLPAFSLSILPSCAARAVSWQPLLLERSSAPIPWMPGSRLSILKRCLL